MKANDNNRAAKVRVFIFLNLLTGEKEEHIFLHHKSATLQTIHSHTPIGRSVGRSVAP